MDVDIIHVIFAVIWIMIMEYWILDYYHFSKMDTLRREYSEKYNELFLQVVEFINDNPGKVEVNVEKRITCPSCGYPMRVLEETDEYYKCYCAGCKMDRWIDKRKVKE